MSLVVWLPLNGNLENQGLSNVTATNNGATVDNNGKIGKCYKFDGTYLTISTGLPANPTVFSFCSWVKLISGYAVNNGCHLVALGNNCRICVSKDGAAICFIGNNANVSCHSSVLSSELIANVWYHVAVTFDNGNVRMYLNGTKVADSNVGATSLNLSNNMSTQVGSYTTELSKAYMNDFRIYDHALSEKEVKELAKGLVLHYRLAGPGQANLTKGNNTYERNSASTDGWFWFSGSNFNCKPSTTYTLSIDIDGTISDFHGGSASTDPAKRWASMWFYLCKTGTSTNAAGGDYDSPILLISTNYNFRKIGPTRYAWTYTTPADARSLSIRGNTYSNGKDAVKVKFWNPKIEEGSIATPWCPRSDESIYTTLGYNNNIEYDCSGFKNNGTIKYPPVWDVNSPRYTTSYRFDGTAYLTIPNPFPVGTVVREFSHTAWIKWDSSCNTSNGIHSIAYGNSFFRFALGKENQMWAYGVRCAADGSGEAEDLITQHGTTNNLINNKWYFIAITFKNGVCKAYLDGEQVASTTSTKVGLKSKTSDGAIGAYGSWGGERAIGNISDSRFYVTELSAADIQELYHSAVIIDNTGKNYAYEYFEA